MIKIGDLVIIDGIKNRWNINCCGEVKSLNQDFADVYVFNINGPGADQLIKDIPISNLSIPKEITL